MNLVVGVDAGGTSTRSVVATSDGHVIGRGHAGGANSNSVSRPVKGGGGAADGSVFSSSLAETLQAALAAALATTDPSAVRVGVLGAAGSAGAGRAVFRSAAVAAWRAVGLPGEPLTVTDLEVAFAAGTASPSGALLLSGTGALAARFENGVLTRRCDGYGWLLGDEGSAVWIGIRGLRAALAALDGRGTPTSLVAAACKTFDIAEPHHAFDIAQPHHAFDIAEPHDTFDIAQPHGREDLAQAILADAFRRPPAELGRLAPSVSAAADAGDEVAQEICAAASARLLHTFDAVEPPPDGAVVLAGSVLLSPGPVSRAVRAGLRDRAGVVRAGLGDPASVLRADLRDPADVLRTDLRDRADVLRTDLRARAGVEPSEARDGAAGAAALAIAELTGAPVSAEVHARLTA